MKHRQAGTTAVQNSVRFTTHKHLVTKNVLVHSLTLHHPAMEMRSSNVRPDTSYQDALHGPV